MPSHNISIQPLPFGAGVGKPLLHRRSFLHTMLSLSLFLSGTAIGPRVGRAQDNPPSLDRYCDTVTLPQSVLVGGQTFGDIDDELRLVSIRTIATQGRFSSDVFSIQPTSRRMFLEDGHYVRLRFSDLSDLDGLIEAELSCDAIPAHYGRAVSPLYVNVATLENIPSIQGYELVSVSGTRYGAKSYLGLWIGTDDTGESMRDSLLVKFPGSQGEAGQDKADFEILTRIPIAFDRVFVSRALHGPMATIYLISDLSKGRGDMVIATLHWSR